MNIQKTACLTDLINNFNYSMKLKKDDKNKFNKQ
jgi:hypothetical protein